MKIILIQPLKLFLLFIFFYSYKSVNSYIVDFHIIVAHNKEKDILISKVFNSCLKLMKYTKYQVIHLLCLLFLDSFFFLPFSCFFEFDAPFSQCGREERTYGVATLILKALSSLVLWILCVAVECISYMGNEIGIISLF